MFPRCRCLKNGRRLAWGEAERGEGSVAQSGGGEKGKGERTHSGDGIGLKLVSFDLREEWITKRAKRKKKGPGLGKTIIGLFDPCPKEKNRLRLNGRSKEGGQSLGVNIGDLNVR